jgi:hypothetical protein
MRFLAHRYFFSFGFRPRRDGLSPLRAEARRAVVRRAGAGRAAGGGALGRAAGGAGATMAVFVSSLTPIVR